MSPQSFMTCGVSMTDTISTPGVWLHGREALANTLDRANDVYRKKFNGYKMETVTYQSTKTSDRPVIEGLWNATRTEVSLSEACSLV